MKKESLCSCHSDQIEIRHLVSVDIQPRVGLSMFILQMLMIKGNWMLMLRSKSQNRLEEVKRTVYMRIGRWIYTFI